MKPNPSFYRFYSTALIPGEGYLYGRSLLPRTSDPFCEPVVEWQQSRFQAHQKAHYRIGYNLYEFLRNLLGADF
jgi:hypothetical protein